jgi:hypothetical protein
MPKLYNYSQTLKIFVLDSWRTAKSSFKFRNWHPVRRVKSTLLTLLLRVWGRRVSIKMRKPIKNYIREIPVIASEPRQKMSA